MIILKYFSSVFHKKYLLWVLSRSTSQIGASDKYHSICVDGKLKKIINKYYSLSPVSEVSKMLVECQTV